jgi:predicted HTH transcriptional regulator
MNLFSGELANISFADIEEFLAIKAPEEQRPTEGVRIDYKLKEPSDFPETVAAFANTYGGLLLIGVESNKKKNNAPIALPGEVFVGGDVKARITGKILSQVTPRPDINVGVAAVLPHSDRYVVVVRVSPGSWPPYQFSYGDRVRIPMRIQDTNRQATL